MKIDRHELIAGQTIKIVRSFMQQMFGLDDRIIDRKQIQRFFSLTEIQLSHLIDALISKNFLERIEMDGQERFRGGQKLPGIRA
jgi:RNase P/RNase MRP subunit p29